MGARLRLVDNVHHVEVHFLGHRLLVKLLVVLLSCVLLQSHSIDRCSGCRFLLALLMMMALLLVFLLSLLELDDILRIMD